MTERLLQERSESLKAEVEELESPLGPDDSDVDFRRILEEARDEQGCAICETFSSDGPSGQYYAMGQAPKKAERTVAAELIRFIK